MVSVLPYESDARVYYFVFLRKSINADRPKALVNFRIAAIQLTLNFGFNFYRTARLQYGSTYVHST